MQSTPVNLSVVAQHRIALRVQEHKREPLHNAIACLRQEESSPTLLGDRVLPEIHRLSNRRHANAMLKRLGDLSSAAASGVV